MENLRLHGLAAVAALMLAASAQAGPVIFNASSGSRAASASFSASGSDLSVTLTNTSLFDVTQPDQILTGVFWDSTVALSLMKISAKLGDGSEVFFDSAPAGGDVGGEWAFKADLSGAAGGADYGISSSGLGLFGPGDRFGTVNLDGPKSIGGMEYGIVPMADNKLTGNSAVTGSNPLIQDQVVFLFSGLAANADPNAIINNVWFQYGTSLSEPAIQGIKPTPPGGGFPGPGGFGNTIPTPSAAAGGIVLLGAALLLGRRAIHR